MAADPAEWVVVPRDAHDQTIRAVYLARGFDQDEADAAAMMAALATEHGVRTHAGLKGVHLDDFLGSAATPPGCIPQAKIEVLESPFKAVEKWNCHRKLGQWVGAKAMSRACELADEFGVGVVVVDDAFHYLWGGGYVMEAAKKGYIAYTNCPAALAEVVPFGGKAPTLGTNPHSFGFPTTEACGYPIVVDWATSVVAMGRVAQLQREGEKLPPRSAVNAEGQFTTDPASVSALVPFGDHKGYGLALVNELYASYIGGGVPTLRCRPPPAGGEGGKYGCTFYFQATRPDAIGCGFGGGSSQIQNVASVIRDIRAHGNENCLLPGQLEAEAATLSAKHGGLLFSCKEVAALAELASRHNVPFPLHTFNRIHKQ